MLKATLDGREAFIYRLQEELQLAKNVESYFAYKLSKWKDIGISNRLQNIDLARNYLDIESVRVDIRDKLVKYERIIFGKESLKSMQPRSHRTSSSIRREIFPNIPIRPDKIFVSYFGGDISTIKDPEVLKLVKEEKKEIEKVFPCEHDTKCKWVLNPNLGNEIADLKFMLGVRVAFILEQRQLMHQLECKLNVSEQKYARVQRLYEGLQANFSFQAEDRKREFDKINSERDVLFARLSILEADLKDESSDEDGVTKLFECNEKLVKEIISLKKENFVLKSYIVDWKAYGLNIELYVNGLMSLLAVNKIPIIGIAKRPFPIHHTFVKLEE